MQTDTLHLWVFFGMLLLLAPGYLIQAIFARPGHPGRRGADLLLLFIGCLLFIKWRKDASPAIYAPLTRAAGLLLFFCAAVIIREKRWSGKSWRFFLGGVCMGFFNLMERIRKWTLRLEAWSCKKPIMAPLFLVGTIFGCCVLYIYSGPESQLGKLTTILFLVSLTLLLLMYTLHSCLHLLFGWFVYGSLLTLIVISLVPRSVTISKSVQDYLLFIPIYSFIWVCWSLLADPEVAKMACSVVNTTTTIALLALNVLLLWGERNLNLPSDLTFLPQELLYYGNLVLLPLVVSGYTAALSLELRAYCQKKQEK